LKEKKKCIAVIKRANEACATGRQKDTPKSEKMGHLPPQVLLVNFGLGVAAAARSSKTGL
jgi:hypothetical protein